MVDVKREAKQKQRFEQVLKIIPKLRLDYLEQLKKELDRIVSIRQKM